MTITKCPGCGVELPSIDGPVHRYMESSAACWNRYGELLAREYQAPDYMMAHRLSVDAYAVQHPGTLSPQSVQSVAVHLISLFAVLNLGYSHRDATNLIKRCANQGTFEWLDPPRGVATLNVLHPLQATSATAHIAAVKEWATYAWQSWSQHHQQIRTWAQAICR
jgi:hypothetical protein